MSDAGREQADDRVDCTCGSEWHYGDCPQRLARVHRHALAEANERRRQTIARYWDDEDDEPGREQTESGPQPSGSDPKQRVIDEFLGAEVTRLRGERDEMRQQLAQARETVELLRDTARKDYAARVDEERRALEAEVERLRDEVHGYKMERDQAWQVEDLLRRERDQAREQVQWLVATLTDAADSPGHDEAVRRWARSALVAWGAEQP